MIFIRVAQVACNLCGEAARGFAVRITKNLLSLRDTGCKQPVPPTWNLLSSKQRTCRDFVNHCPDSIVGAFQVVDNRGHGVSI